MPESASASVAPSVADPAANSVATYGAFVNWLTNRSLTPAPPPRERGSFYRLSLWERPTRESAAGEGRRCHLFSECASVPKIYLARLRVGDHFAARSLDDHAAVMEDSNPLRQIERRIHVVLDHDHGHIPWNPGDQRFHRDALLERESGKRLIEQQQLGFLRERHRDLDASLFSVGHFADRSRGALIEADQSEHPARLFDETGFKGKRVERVPAHAR